MSESINNLMVLFIQNSKWPKLLNVVVGDGRNGTEFNVGGY